MAKETTTPTKATKAGIVKRTPVKASASKASSAKVLSSAYDRDVMFLWKCIKLSPGVKIDWSAVAQDAGKSVGTVQKQWSRLNQKLEKNIQAAAPSDSDDDAEDDANEMDTNDSE